MTWNMKANLRGPAGYNATGAAEDDAAIAAFIESAVGTTATREALEGAVAPQLDAAKIYPEMSDFLGKLAAQQNDVTFLVLSDSTGAQAGAWTRTIREELQALFPAHRVAHKFWNGNTWDPAYYSPNAPAAGKSLTMWNGSQAGMTWDYALAPTRVQSFLRDPAPDLVIFSYGHNDNFGWSDKDLREKAVRSIESIRTYFPGAAVLLSSQNVAPAWPGLSERRGDIYRRIAQERGYGYIDTVGAFKRDGRPMSDLVQADNIHPTDAGSLLWRDEILKHFRSAIGTPLRVAEPSYFEGRLNLLPNGRFTDFAAPPALPGFTPTNITLSKDTATRESAYSVKAVKAATGATSKLESAAVRAGFQGREVTFAVRMFIPTGAPATAGYLYVTTPNNALQQSQPPTARDRWFWNTLTATINTNADYAYFGIFIDPTTGDPTQPIYIDRASVTLGRYPSDS